MIKNIYKLSEKNDITILGLMTGTSADGLDMACVRFSGTGRYPAYDVLYSDFIPYPGEFSTAFKHPLELSASEVADLHMRLGKWYGDVISKLGLDYDLVASHGQTLLHRPPAYTLQIGEAQCIADACGRPVVYDFRTADVMVGGQGAPLIPVVDEFLLRDERTSVIALNMGGIANMTFLPPRRSNEDILAWDTGPANTLIDKAVIDFTNGKELFDKNGDYARSASIDDSLLSYLMDHEYLVRPRPKSAGQEQFGYEYYTSVKARVNPGSRNTWLSFIRTLTEFTVLSIADDIKAMISGKASSVKIIVSGGGARNQFIMERLRDELPECQIARFDMKNISSDIKEAFGFAYLGYLFIRGLPGNIPSVTGASRKTILGKIVF